MRIGIFTDTYAPQVSGVATSIKTLKTELTKLGHTVFIFTTTDKDVNRYEDWQIIRIPSVPFFAFKERRIAYAGFADAVKIAERYDLDIIHTQTEFSLGILGKMIAKELKIPVVHTYHTHYEDYVHYFAKGKIIRPRMVRYIVRAFCSSMDGVICPSQIVQELLEDYGVEASKQVIPTGINLAKFERPEISQPALDELRTKLGLAPEDTMLLSLSRVSYEKNIQAVIQAMPAILKKVERVKLVVAGDGPYLADLKKLAQTLGLEDLICFTGMIPPSDTALFYKAADFFVSASTSETQGLTYLESLASGTPIIAQANPYLADLISDKTFGTLYPSERDLADGVIDAILTTPAMTAQILADKLYEISAENFGKRVEAFYQELLNDYEEKNRQSEASVPVLLARRARATSMLLARRTIKLPKRVIISSTVRSRRLLRRLNRRRDK